MMNMNECYYEHIVLLFIIKPPVTFTKSLP